MDSKTGVVKSIEVLSLTKERRVKIEILGNEVNCMRYHLPGGSDSKESAYNVGDPDSIPGSGGPSGEANDYALQYSYLENRMDRGGWRVTVHGIVKSQT